MLITYIFRWGNQFQQYQEYSAHVANERDWWDQLKYFCPGDMVYLRISGDTQDLGEVQMLPFAELDLNDKRIVTPAWIFLTTMMNPSIDIKLVKLLNHTTHGPMQDGDLNWNEIDELAGSLNVLKI